VLHSFTQNNISKSWSG